jgi:hypothetical protein
VISHENGDITRILGVLRLEIWADTPSGPKVLLQSSQQLQDGRTRHGLANRLAKKMSAGESVEDAVFRALFTELRLPPEWQKKHLVEEKRNSTTTERASRGYPGVKTVYNFHTLHMKVQDPTETDCARIGLPEGEDFETEEGTLLGTDRKHFWVWRSEVPKQVAEEKFGSNAHAEAVFSKKGSSMSMGKRLSDGMASMSSWFGKGPSSG